MRRPRAEIGARAFAGMIAVDEEEPDRLAPAARRIDRARPNRAHMRRDAGLLQVAEELVIGGAFRHQDCALMAGARLTLGRALEMVAMATTGGRAPRLTPSARKQVERPR